MSEGEPPDSSHAAAAGPLIDLQDGGIGDVVVACWMVHSAAAAGLRLRLNPRGRRVVAEMLGLGGDALTGDAGANWTRTEGLGLRFEYQQIRQQQQGRRFDHWCRSLNLPALPAVRPPYREAPADAEWAEAEWRGADPDGSKPRVLMFPEAAWLVRQWPLAYFIDLGTALRARGCAVTVMGTSRSEVEALGFRWLAGHSLERMAALARRAALVVANDSGPAHLAGTIGTRTLALCGPTDGAVVFGHDPNVTALAVAAAVLPCVGCHFDTAHGYRFACKVGGCQALMKLDPPAALAAAAAMLNFTAR